MCLFFPSPPEPDVQQQFGDLFSVLWLFVPPIPEKCPVLSVVFTAQQFYGILPVFASGEFRWLDARFDCGFDCPAIQVAGLLGLAANHFALLSKSVASCPF